MSGFTIPIAADTRDAVKAIDDVTTGLQANADALDQVAQAGPEAGDAVTKGMQEAQEATSKLTTTTKQAISTGDGFKPMALESASAFDVLAQSAQKAGKGAQEATEQTEKLATSGQKVGQQTEEGGKLAESALMNVAFSAGSAGEALDGPGGLLSSVGTFAAFMATSFGPEIGFPVAALGIGMALVGTAIQGAGTAAQQNDPAIKSLIGDFEDGVDGVNAFDKALRDWAKDATDYGGENIADFAKDVKTVGLNFNDVAGTITGKSVPALNAMLKELDNIKELNDKFAESGLGSAKVIKQAEDEAGANDKVREAISKKRDAAKEAAEEEKVLADAMGLTVEQYKNYEKAVQEAKDDQKNWNSAVSDSFNSAATDSDDYFKGQQVNWDQEQKNLQEVTDAYSKFPATIKQLTKDGLDAAGKEFAESNFTPAQLEQLMTLPADQRQNIINQWNTAGKDAKKGLKDGISAGDIGDVTVPVKADTKQAKSDIKHMGDGVSATIGTKADTKGADADLDQVAGQKRTATIDAKADTKDAKDDLDGLTKKRTVKVTADLDSSQFTKDLNYLLRDRSITVTVNERVGKKVNT